MSQKKRVAISLEMAWMYKHHHDIFAGIQQYARKCSDWECIISPYPEEFLQDKIGPPFFDGIIGRATRPIAAAALQAGIPLINVWYSSPVSEDVITVVPDYVEAGRMAARHLLARGFRHFVFVGTTRRDKASQDSYKGYAEVIKKAQFPLTHIRVPTAFAENYAGWLKFHSIIDKWLPGQQKPVGICCYSDVMARFMSNDLIQKGVEVPHEAAFISLDNEEMICLTPEPSLSSIECGQDRVGYHAAELLDQIIEGEAISSQTIYLPPVKLVQRQSTDALAVENDMVAAALRFIADECHNPIKVGDVAAAVSVSRRTLERRFSEVMNRTVVSHINQQRIERAKRLLVESDRLVKQIAKECGFLDGEQMCHVFTRLVGISPRAFRDQSKMS